MYRSRNALVRAVLAATLGGLVLTGCDPAPPAASSTGAAGATSATPAADPTAGPTSAPAGSEGGNPTVVRGSRPTAPITAVRADALAKAWSTRWHVKLELVQNDLVHVQRATVDYPPGHGRLELSVQQEGTGTDPAPSVVGCTMRDKSLGRDYVKLSRALLTRILTDCWGAVLAKGEATRIAEWALANNKLNESGGVRQQRAFARFTVLFEVSPTVVGFEMIAT